MSSGWTNMVVFLVLGYIEVELLIISGCPRAVPLLNTWWRYCSKNVDVL